MCFACDLVGQGSLVTADPWTVVQVYGLRFISRLAREQRANLENARALLCKVHFGNYCCVIEALERSVVMSMAKGASGDAFLEKQFPITSVSRKDITSLGATGEELTQLSDEDMEAIASRIGELYVEYGNFWVDLGSAVNQRLEKKGLVAIELADVPNEEGDNG